MASLKQEMIVLHYGKGYKTITGHDWKPGNVSRTTAMNGLTAK
jgi:hypothetical protein